jgi:hypothetical protein
MYCHGLISLCLARIIANSRRVDSDGRGKSRLLYSASRRGPELEGVDIE